MGFGLSGQPRVGRPNEIVEFAKAWLGTALAFAVLFGGVRLGNLDRLSSPGFLQLLLLSGLTAGVGVVLHELAHRVVARSFGADAYFVANDGMLVLSVILAIAAGFLFAAPGAVWHRGATSPRQLGLIAVAGPVVNIVLALVFAVAIFAARSAGLEGGLVYGGLQMGFLINALLAVFNMIPFGPLDGAKVLAWNGLFFGVVIAIAIAIAFGLPRVFDFLPALFGR
jgi:Zn-dependent protease